MSEQTDSLGPAIELGADTTPIWAYIPHFIHSPFYVYAYAFGDCLVNSLYGVYQGAREGFAERYLAMLSAGGTKHHSELLAPFGLDAARPGLLANRAEDDRVHDRRFGGIRGEGLTQEQTRPPVTHPTFRLTLITVAGTAAYLGLAVLGWGGFAAFFSHPALTGVAIVTFALSGAALFSRGNLSSGVREDRGNRWIFVPLAVIGVLSAYLPAYTDRLDVWTIDGDATRWLGLALYTVGGVLRLWPVFVLGRRFSGLVAIQPGHSLVTSGIYSIIRHPSYLGLLIGSLGWGLAFRSVAGVLLAVLTVPVILARIRAEEALLRTQFGAEYDAYRARTARLIPGIY